MQQKYKYRAKRLDGKGWVYGMPVQSVNDRCYMIVGATEDAVNTRNEVDFMYVEVDPGTLGEYTGMKDINGKEICAGDIIECFYMNVFAICNYVPNWYGEDSMKLVRENFQNVYTFYP